MPLSPTSNEPEHVPEDVIAQPESASSNAPVSVVPHNPDGTLQQRPVKIRTGRFGELEEHELVRLLDTIEDERARSRFRESVYISMFVWMVVLWLMLYGPRYLWHAPKVVNPIDALKEHELTELTNPHLRAPAPKPPMRVDNKTLETLRKNAPPAPAAAPTPVQPAPVQPTPTPATTPAPPAPTPQPSHTAAPIVDAPTPQPSVNFGKPASPSDALNNASRGTRSSGNVGSGLRAPGGANLGGAMEYLTDTQGVNFDPWAKRLVFDTERAWGPLLPEETEAPLLKQGETFLRIKMKPDGTILDMHLDGPSGDMAIDKSCWAAITSQGALPALPKEFHGSVFEFRLRFVVNKRLD